MYFVKKNHFILNLLSKSFRFCSIRTETVEQFQVKTETKLNDTTPPGLSRFDLWVIIKFEFNRNLIVHIPSLGNGIGEFMWYRTMNNCVHHNPKPAGGNSPELVDFLPVLNLGALRKKIKVRMMLIDCTKLLGECLRNDRFGEKKNKRKKRISAA